MGWPVHVENPSPAIEIKAEHIAITEQPKPLPEERRPLSREEGAFAVCLVLSIILCLGAVLAYIAIQQILKDLPEMIQNWRKTKDAWRNTHDRD